MPRRGVMNRVETTPYTIAKGDLRATATCPHWSISPDITNCPIVESLCTLYLAATSPILGAIHLQNKSNMGTLSSNYFFHHWIYPQRN